MKTLGIWSVALGALIALTASENAHAQGFRGGLGYQVLRNKSLQRELNLSGEQPKKVDTIVEEAALKFRLTLQAIPEADRPQKSDEVFQ